MWPEQVAATPDRRCESSFMSLKSICSVPLVDISCKVEPTLVSLDLSVGCAEVRDEINLLIVFLAVT